MQTITLRLKDAVMSGIARVPVAVDALTPDKLFGKSAEQIKAVNVWWGNSQEKAGNLFEVKLEGTAASANEVKLVFEGKLKRVKHIGGGMKAGEIEARGDVDMHCGAEMEGGRVVVKGNADCWAGREMRGGELVIEGNAGDNLCAMYRGEIKGMTGGKVTVYGNTGECVAQYMAGGELLIKGNVDILCGLNMSGGKITIEGNAILPGADMIGGEIIVKGKVLEMMPSFKFIETATIDGAAYKKYLGDFAMGEKKAKGTIYVK